MATVAATVPQWRLDWPKKMTHFCTEPQKFSHNWVLTADPNSQTQSTRNCSYTAVLSSFQIFLNAANNKMPCCFSGMQRFASEFHLNLTRYPSNSSPALHHCRLVVHLFLLFYTDKWSGQGVCADDVCVCALWERLEPQSKYQKVCFHDPYNFQKPKCCNTKLETSQLQITSQVWRCHEVLFQTNPYRGIVHKYCAKMAAFPLRFFVPTWEHYWPVELF